MESLATFRFTTQIWCPCWIEINHNLLGQHKIAQNSLPSKKGGETLLSQQNFQAYQSLLLTRPRKNFSLLNRCPAGKNLIRDSVSYGKLFHFWPNTKPAEAPLENCIIVSFIQLFPLPFDLSGGVYNAVGAKKFFLFRHDWASQKKRKHSRKKSS